jgi:hypothetical protein
MSETDVLVGTDGAFLSSNTERTPSQIVSIPERAPLSERTPLPVISAPNDIFIRYEIIEQVHSGNQGKIIRARQREILQKQKLVRSK